MKQNLSVVYITKNAASTFEQSLSSIDFANEIIVVDSGSSDETLKIAEKYKAKITFQDWLGFGKQKQLAVNLATHDWVLCLDADEIISFDLRKSIQAALTNPTFKAYQFPRSNYFLGRYLKHGEGYPDLSLRLFNKNNAAWSDDAVHEYVDTKSEVGTLTGDLLHHSCENISDYLTKQNNYTDIQAKQLWLKNKKTTAVKIIFSPIFRFIKFYFIKRGFLDGLAGFVHISIGCFNSMIKYAKLHELQKNNKLKNDQK